MKQLDCHKEEVKSVAWILKDEEEYLITAGVDKKLVFWNICYEEVEWITGSVFLEIASTLNSPVIACSTASTHEIRLFNIWDLTEL